MRRRVSSPSASMSGTSRISLFAACSSSCISLRVRAMSTAGPCRPLSAGNTLSITTLSFGPRIRSTTSSIRQPMTSWLSPSLPWLTPTIRSPGCRRLSKSAGPPGMISRMMVYSPSVPSKAPIPSNERLIAISKFSEVRGDMYEVCGSTDDR